MIEGGREVKRWSVGLGRASVRVRPSTTVSAIARQEPNRFPVRRPIVVVVVVVAVDLPAAAMPPRALRSRSR